MTAYIRKPKCKPVNASRLRNWNLMITSHKQPTRLKLQQLKNFLNLLPPFLYKGLSQSSCLWSIPKYFQFGAAWFELIFAQINSWKILICLSLPFFKLIFYWGNIGLKGHSLSFNNSFCRKYWSRHLIYRPACVLNFESRWLKSHKALRKNSGIFSMPLNVVTKTIFDTKCSSSNPLQGVMDQ